MKWRDRLILGGLIAAILSIAIVLTGRIQTLNQEQKNFEILREQVKDKRKKTETSPEIQESIGADEKLSKVTGNLEAEKEILPEYREICLKNKNFAGWIRIAGTKVDYPVMQNLEDREYYLHRDFFGKKSYAGVPFVGHGSLESEPEAVFIYGHNMRNGTMFADLMKYKEEKFWKKNPEISLDTRYEHRTYRIFTAFYADAAEWNEKGSALYLMAAGNRQYESCLSELKDRGLYVTGTEIGQGKNILVLVTCSYQKENQRFVVVGVQVN